MSAQSDDSGSSPMSDLQSIADRQAGDLSDRGRIEAVESTDAEEKVVPPSGDDETARRAADYVENVLMRLDELPQLFAQRRSTSRLRALTWFGWLTMPGNRQLTQLYVRRQLSVTLGRLKAETGLAETAGDGRSESAARLNVLVEAVGAKTPSFLPIVIVLGTIGVLVSLLSVVVPDLQQEADLLGSLPQIVTLNGAAVADNATAFDNNSSVFSPKDFEGVFKSLGLAAIVVWGLFSVLAGSAHAAASILDDPWRYRPSSPFRRSVERGPVPTQRGVFGEKPNRIHTPVAPDLIRNAAFYVLILLAPVFLQVLSFGSGSDQFVEYSRVGSAEVGWMFFLLAFPATLLIAYLIVRHRRASNGTGEPPRNGWLVGLGAVLAFSAGFFYVSAVNVASDTRWTTGADLSVYLADDFFAEADLERFEAIPGLQVQSISWWDVGVGVPDGVVAAELLVTELDTAGQYVSAEIDAEALGRLDASEVKQISDVQDLPKAWISDGLAAQLDPTQGNQIEIPIDENELFKVRVESVFRTPESSLSIVVIDVQDLPEELPFLVDEILLRATGVGPLHDDDETYALVDQTLAQYGPPGELVDLRRELWTVDDRWGLLAAMALVIGVFAIVIAFGWPGNWKSDSTQLAEPFGPDRSRSAPPTAAERTASDV